jgi:hypothetical protein
MKYEIIKETEKAYKIKAEGIETWIPKSWVKKSGDLGVYAVEKVGEEKANKEHLEHTKTFDLQDNIKSTDCAVLKETEKALNVMFFFSQYGWKDVTVWIPKSMTRTYDFVNKKVIEAGGLSVPIRA